MLRFVLFLTMLAAGRQGAWASDWVSIAGVMPWPMKLDSAPGLLAIDGSFAAVAMGCPDARMEGALNRLTARISRQTGIPMGLAKPAEGGRPSLRVECPAAGSRLPAFGEDESYALDIWAEGARRKAATGAGALHGLETFIFIITAATEIFPLPPLHTLPM